MTKPVRSIKHTHDVLVLSHTSHALHDTTVGRTYPAEVCPKGEQKHNGGGAAHSAFIALVDDAGDVVILYYSARPDIKLTPVK